jgi:hypothetical protein
MVAMTLVSIDETDVYSSRKIEFAASAVEASGRRRAFRLVVVVVVVVVNCCRR